MHSRLRHFTWPSMGLLLVGMLLIAACGNNAEPSKEAEGSGAVTTEEESISTDSGQEVKAVAESELGTELEPIEVSMPSDPVKRDGFFDLAPPRYLTKGRSTLQSSKLPVATSQFSFSRIVPLSQLTISFSCL